MKLTRTEAEICELYSRRDSSGIVHCSECPLVIDAVDRVCRASIDGRLCGTCKYHKHESIDDGWICVNADSEYVADWTEYDFCCDEWEGRE